MVKIIPWLSLAWAFQAAAAPATADIDGAVSQVAADFPQCIVTFSEQARREGISEAIIQSHVQPLQFVKRVIELDRQQPEFTQTFAGYFDKRVTDWRVSKGRELLAAHRPFLQQLTAQYGIPPQYLLAFWGMETNYGGYKGKMPVLDSLATLACDHRRSAFFTKELMTALKLSQRYGFAAADMQGSWAGAMGHTQFMPSAYARYAVDANGDGKADLWNSTEDALASAANFLQHLGWQRNERWGREVRLPKGFDYTLLNEQLPLARWQQLGLTSASGQLLPQAQMQARLYLPAGHQGPAFLGYQNFDVIKRWNRSNFYAISVGHLADRIAGAGKLHTPAPQQPRLSHQQIKALQQQLNALGFDSGTPDGILGSNSRNSLRAFQASKGLIADGFPDEATFKALGLNP
ncbi:lytic murein transglycosylase [Shewanella sp. YIC-542]|uniref:lytic murein transglycosylase n=1 Tax=Shewanella mytili TaxID=3377111 RepID=UPI00398F34C1